MTQKEEERKGGSGNMVCWHFWHYDVLPFKKYDEYDSDSFDYKDEYYQDIYMGFNFRKVKARRCGKCDLCQVKINDGCYSNSCHHWTDISYYGYIKFINYVHMRARELGSSKWEKIHGKRRQRSIMDAIRKVNAMKEQGVVEQERLKEEERRRKVEKIKQLLDSKISKRRYEIIDDVEEYRVLEIR